MAKKRRKPATVKHLWQIVVRHRDWNSPKVRSDMMTTELWIVSPQKPDTKPSIEMTLVEAKKFIYRNRRQYSIETIKHITNHGFIDN